MQWSVMDRIGVDFYSINVESGRFLDSLQDSDCTFAMFNCVLYADGADLWSRGIVLKGQKDLTGGRYGERFRMVVFLICELHWLNET